MLHVPLRVTDQSGFGFQDWPVSAIVPLPAGVRGDTGLFRVVDRLGRTVPAQFAILRGLWGDDARARFLLVHFLASAGPHRGEGTGTAEYFLTDVGPPPPMGSPLVVEETSSGVTVVTGPLKLVVDARRANLLGGVWLDRDGSGRFEGDEAVVLADRVFVSPGLGEKREDHGASRVTVEEAGPLRVVLRVDTAESQAPGSALFSSTSTWITAYAGQSFLEMRTQRKSVGKDAGAAGQSFSASFGLRYRLALRDPVQVTVGLADGSVLRQERGRGLVLIQDGFDRFRLFDRPGGTHLRTGMKADGFLDVSGATHGVTVVMRRFTETWPNGLGVDAQNILWVGTGWERDGRRPARVLRGEGAEETFSSASTGALAVKEFLLVFHGPRTDPQSLRRRAAGLGKPPPGCFAMWAAAPPRRP
jgi:hypothetical protein